LTIKDIDWIEINEAFATVVLGWARELKPDMAKVNPWGGAIAHGHPLGASGAGLMAKMLHDSRRPAAGSACKPCASATAWPRPRSSSEFERVGSMQGACARSAV
jgi:acetyl-CoA acetyltransferase